MSSQNDNLRYCERMKDTGGYFHVEALAKKLRKGKKFPQSIDAEMEQRQIEMFYKAGWEYEHSHATFSCDISPVMMAIPTSTTKEKMNKLNIEYEKSMREFIYRFKTEQEDESLLKIEEEWYRSCEQLRKQKTTNTLYGFGALKSILNAIYGISLKMKNNLSETISENGTQSKRQYWKVIYIFKMILHWLNTENIQPQQCYQPEKTSDLNSELAKNSLSERGISCVQFASNFIQIFERVLDGKKSAFLGFQPAIGKLTYLVHPLLIGIYANYEKQLKIWQYCKEAQSKIPHELKVRGLPLIKDVKDYNISKVALINLDGYESEFNIELAKNLDKHLMYVSFPKFKNSEEEAYGLRFFKKIMFQFTRELYENDSELFNYFVEDANLPEEPEQKMEDLINSEYDNEFNPQNYYKNVDSLYHDAKKIQKGTNIYILPIQFDYLRKEFSNLFQDKSSIEKYESYFLRFAFSNFFGDDLKKFTPNVVILSYSGRISVEEKHFINIIQELASVSERKCIFFPNFTTLLANEDLQNDELSDSEEIEELESGLLQYDNIIEDSNIRDTFGFFRKNQLLLNESFMDKISQFFKICSGTYNLTKAYEPETLISKYKSSKIYTYSLQLLTALGENSEHLKGRVSSLSMKAPQLIFNKGIETSLSDIDSAVPPFYHELFSIIRKFITGQLIYSGENHEILELIQKNRKNYGSILNQNQLKINLNDPFLLRKIEISQEKYQENAYIYIKTKDQQNQFKKIETPNKETDLQGFHVLEMYCRSTNGDKIIFPIFKKTELIYNSDQKKIKSFNLMLMNNFNLKQASVNCYGGQAIISDNAQGIQNQRIEMYPITFHNNEGNYSKFTVKKDWNYAETSSYYILFWPVEFDYLEFTLRKMQNLSYSPSTSRNIYLAEIPKKKHILEFYEVQTNDNFIPRTRTSNYVFEDKIFIFGGFYDKQHNYLKLQNDISSIDVRNFNMNDRKLLVQNEKIGLYGQNLCENSFIRPKSQIQFFDYFELSENQANDDQEKQLIVFGGIGQNFTRSFSLLSNYYYKLIISSRNRRIVSIKRHTISDNVAVTNVKKSIQNKSSFEIGNLYDKDERKLKQIKLNPEHEIHHRMVYKLQHKNLLWKVKALFATPPPNKYQGKFEKFGIKTGFIREISEQIQSSEYFLSHALQGNHYLLLKQNENTEKVKICLQVENQKKQLQNVALPHSSVISIDFKSKNIFAIVHHSLYTRGDYILAFAVPTFSVKNKTQINLKRIHTFENNMSKYVLFVSRPHQMLLLNGISLINSKAPELNIKYKKEKNFTKIEQISSILIQQKEYTQCYSFFYKDQNPENRSMEIQCYNLLIFSEKTNNQVKLVSQRLKLNSQLQYEWQKEGERVYSFYDEETQQKIALKKINQMRYLEQKEKLMIMVSDKRTKGCVGYFGTDEIVKMSQTRYSDDWKEGKPLQLRIKNRLHEIQ